MKSVKVAEIVESAASELQLEVLAGRSGFSRTVNVTRIQKPGLALTGYVDFVQGHRVQILGSTELTYLERLDEVTKTKACDGFCAVDIAMIICTKGMSVPTALIAACERTGTPLLSTPQTTDVFISRVEGWLEDRLAPQTTMHGVLVEVYGLGVLMLGKSGIGKSELALDLVQRGHPLVADDVVTIRRRGVETLYGQGSGLTKHLLEIRGLGILNVKDLFGVSAVREKKRIDLVSELVEWRADEEYDRLGVDERFFTILDVEVPLITIPVRPGRNMGVIVEAAARNQLLKSMGRHSALDLQERLARELARGHVKSDVE
ncbi:MAG: HPr(Ser) kinase/phosphatase [Deltaproteobacteria bacterium]|nr:HPr(Ser) kinase/phosphatase [Deltaproteobacteria bacterium]